MKKEIAIGAFAASAAGVGVVYLTAFLPSGPPRIAVPVMIVSIATMMVSAMVIGAVRDDRIGRLAAPFLGAWLVMVIGFLAALVLPPETVQEPNLLLGIPRRAAIVLYGIGLLPLVVMPFAYAWTFDEATLSAADLTRLRAAAEEILQAEQAEAAGVMLAIQTAPLPHATDPAIWAVGVIYFAVVIAIGVWATRRTRTANDFFVAGGGSAGGGIGLWPAALAAMSATVSGFAFIGGPGLVYGMGVGAVYIMLPAAITGAMSAWVLAKRMRLLGEFRGLVTVPDAIGLRYRSPFAQGLAGVAMLIAIIGYMGTNILALGIVIDAIFGIGLTAGIWIGAGITLAYSAAGGILAGVYTDVFQGALMAVAAVLVFTVTLKVGDGMSGISHTLLATQPLLLGPWGTVGPLAALSFFFLFGMGSLGQPHVIHKYYMLRDPRMLKWLPLLITGAMLLTILLFFGVGITMRAVVERGDLAPLARNDQATPVFLLTYPPLLLAGLVLSGVAAAIMSTVNSLMNIGAAVFTYDLPKAFGRTPSHALASGRIWTVVIAVAAALLAQLPGALVAFLGIFAFGLFAATLVPAMAIGLNWHGATREGAIASITTGLVGTLALEALREWKMITLPAGVSASALAFVLSFLVFFAVSWATRNKVRPETDPIVRLVMDA